MVGTPHLQPAPSPSSDTCARAVTRPAVAESAFASLDLILDSQSQEGSEEAVVVVVVVVVDHQVNVFEGESQVASGVDTQDSQVCHSSSSEI